MTTILVAWGLKVWHYANFFPGSSPGSRSEERVYYEQHADRVWLVFHRRVYARASIQMRSVEGTREDDEIRRADLARELRSRWRNVTKDDIDAAYDEARRRYAAEPDAVAPWWARRPDPGKTIVSVAYGWPMPALMIWAESPWRLDRPRSVVWVPTSWRATRQRMFGGTQHARTPLTLPLLPIATGFTVNVIFYAGVWWLIVSAPGILIRARRRAKGRCPRCNYDIVGLNTCPECATPVSRRGRRTPAHPA